MNRTSRIWEDEKDDEEGGCRRSDGWMKGMPWKREMEEGDVEEEGRRRRGRRERGQDDEDVEGGIRVKETSREGAG